MFSSRIWLMFVATQMLLLFAIGSATAQSSIPQSTGYVNDSASVVDNITKKRLETTLGDLDQQLQIKIVVVTVETTGGQDISDYSQAVAREWSIASKNTKKRSLLLVVAINDRKYFTQVSRPLETILPDELLAKIQRERLVAAFTVWQFSKGFNR